MKFHFQATLGTCCITLALSSLAAGQVQPVPAPTPFGAPATTVPPSLSPAPPSTFPAPSVPAPSVPAPPTRDPLVGETEASSAEGARVVVSLNDGSKLIGSPVDWEPLSVKTSFGEVEIKWSLIRGCLGTGVVQLSNGDRITGTLQVDELKLKTAVGEVAIPAAEIRAVGQVGDAAEWAKRRDGWHLMERTPYAVPQPAAYYPADAPSSYSYPTLPPSARPADPNAPVYSS